MGRYHKPMNRDCSQCGNAFRVSDKDCASGGGCRRCKACRTGKQGTPATGRVGWHVCPKCGDTKVHAATTCLRCYRDSVEKEKADE